jgi:hypothetical protein
VVFFLYKFKFIDFHINSFPIQSSECVHEREPSIETRKRLFEGAFLFPEKAPQVGIEPKVPIFKKRSDYENGASRLKEMKERRSLPAYFYETKCQGGDRHHLRSQPLNPKNPRKGIF